MIDYAAIRRMSEKGLEYQLDCAEAHDDTELALAIDAEFEAREAGYNGPTYDTDGDA